MKRLVNAPYFLLVLSALFWGGNSVAGKYLAGSIPPVMISFIRITISVLITLPFLIPILKKEFRVAKANIKELLVLAVTGVIGFNLLSYWALNYTTAINGALLNSTSPLFMFLLSYLITREKVRFKYLLSITISIIGVIFVITQGSLERLLAFQFNVGDLIMLLAVNMWAIYSIRLKGVSEKLTSLSIFGFSLCLGLLLVIPAVVVEALLIPIERITLSEWGALLYLALFPSVGSFLLWNRAVVLIGPSRSSIFLNLIPVFGAIMAFLWLGEVITFYQVIGGGLVFLGILISSDAKRVPKLEMKEEKVN